MKIFVETHRELHHNPLLGVVSPTIFCFDDDTHLFYFMLVSFEGMAF